VRSRAEGDFLSRLRAPQKHVYECELSACDRKYVHEEGTKYLSFAAFCSAEVAQRYSQRALKLSRSKR